jgi:hypothetical protein
MKPAPVLKAIGGVAVGMVEEERDKVGVKKVGMVEEEADIVVAEGVVDELKQD